MYLSKMLEEAVKNKNGRYMIDDLELHSDKYGVDVAIFWNTLCFNVGIYPIIQVDDDNGNTILWKSGSEDPRDWYRWMEEILEDYLDADDWSVI